MKDINFRGWGPTVDNPSLSIMTSFTIYDFHWTFYIDKKSHPNIADMIVMQSTNSYDSNGQEIYEGDILRYDYPTGYSLCEVKFGIYDNGENDGDNVSGNGWYVIEDSTLYTYENQKNIYTLTTDQYPFANKCFYVVGNIYENKKLLEDLHKKCCCAKHSNINTK